jgi:hypothetical protein
MSYVCVFLWDDHWVGHPSQCFDFSDEALLLGDGAKKGAAGV